VRAVGREGGTAREPRGRGGRRGRSDEATVGGTVGGRGGQIYSPLRRHRRRTRKAGSPPAWRGSVGLRVSVLRNHRVVGIISSLFLPYSYLSHNSSLCFSLTRGESIVLHREWENEGVRE
jgi:hypothetical protein